MSLCPKLALIIAVFQSLFMENVANVWNYERHGPDTWPYTFESCEGEYQSPINIRTGHTVYDPKLKDINLVNYVERTWNLSNNGMSIIGYQIHTLENDRAPFITGSNFDDTYSLLQFHFHWGLNDYQGSEHLIDDKKYPLELHLVHVSEEHKKLAVLGFLFEISEKNNTDLDELLRSVEYLKDQKHAFTTSTFSLTTLLPDADLLKANGYYRYNGSLTTPPCTEGVSWTIFRTRINISSSQMESFRSNILKFNFREPQKIYKRTIRCSIDLNKQRMDGLDMLHLDDHQSDQGLHHYLIDLIISVFNLKTYYVIFKTIFSV